MTLPRWNLHPSAPPPGTVLCRLDELAEHGGKEFVFGEEKRPFRMFVLEHRGVIRAYVNSCTHFEGTPLNPNNVGNFLDKNNTSLIYCGVHGSRFDAETGACVSGDCDGVGLEPVPVTRRDDLVLIDTPLSLL
ncbi:MAG: Rieske 2Fe-2S domain-containing protein [Magnetococcales bacterium]|nr:Rieske 2Fe-2S domain-containing protein [Magnetococcales bacterium]